MSQVLSQSEVDALLSAVSDNKVDEDEGGGDGIESGERRGQIGGRSEIDHRADRHFVVAPGIALAALTFVQTSRWRR